MNDQNLFDRAQTLRAVFILGGDITKAEDPAYLGIGWRSLKGTEKDHTGGMPSFERVQAAAALWRMNQKLILIPSGGVSNVEGQANGTPAIAEVMAAELIAEGVPPSNIIKEEKAFNTREHFAYCPEIARTQGWKANEIAALSLFFHFGRVTAILKQLGESTAPFSLAETTFISAERALAAEDAKWNTYFTDLYNSADMSQTLIGETMGTGQLWAGHSPRFPHPFKGFTDPLVDFK